jgi:hypothetical protein
LALPFFSGGPYKRDEQKDERDADDSTKYNDSDGSKIHGMISLICAVKDERLA